MAQSTFVDKPVGVMGAVGWLEIAADPIEWPGAVDGYNLCYLRPEATAATIMTDEYKAPLVASWQRGIGRVGAVSFPTGGESSERVRGWAGYGDFLQTLVQWLVGEEIPQGVGFQTRTVGTTLEIDLFFDERWVE